MSERKYKSWVFTWHAYEDGIMPEEKDLVQLLESETNLFVFQKERCPESGRLHYQGAFVTKIRVRHSTLITRFSKYFPNFDIKLLTINKMLGTWEDNYIYCTKDESREVESQVQCSASLKKYSGADLKMLEDRFNWFSWEKEVYNQIFNEYSGDYEIPDDRKIYWITDTAGNCGKSKFIKYLCHTHSDIIKVPFGTSIQIRNSLISIGPRKCYIIDIPRELGSEDSLASTLSVIEDLKNGFVVSAMFGTFVQLMMNPPHVYVFSNMPMASGRAVSRNRWTKRWIDPSTYTLSSRPTMTHDPDDDDNNPWNFLEED
jgi:hypothetical protein